MGEYIYIQAVFEPFRCATEKVDAENLFFG